MNHAALRAFWHPVAYADAVKREPVGAILLDTPIVLWRDTHATVHANLDRCVHRGTQLSLGTVQGDRLVCPYHGWHFDADGQCTRMPQLADPERVPSKARVPAFQCQERYGLVWVALDAPRWPLPEVPELSDAQWRTVRTGPFAWNSHASRQLENFTDFGHFAFVHEGLLGDAAQAEVAPYEVVVDAHVVRYAYRRPDQPNTVQLPVFADAPRKEDQRNTRYAIHLPFTIVEHIDWGGADGMVYFFVSQPVSADRAIGYCLVARNYNLDQPDAVMQEFERVIFEQDRRIIESQWPRAVPAADDPELHMVFDKVAIAYRQALRLQGLA
jgi:phenylpropionate dioxygenase-like ring-hydroxylating dioxygenase large terminal subunit